MRLRWRRQGPRAPINGEVPGVTRLQLLATGGNSTVYRGWQSELDRWVAVKVLGLTLADRRARERFLRECKAVGRLTGHPNIVTVLTSGITRDNRPFLTMDLFERGSLAGHVAQSGPLPVEQALRLGVKLAGALETAHRAGILHLDLKPENVLLSHFGEPGLADFGIATLGEARGETKAFTPSHAAPEILEGRPPTPAADIYGLGSTLWTALAGRLPFGDDDQGILKLMHRVLEEPLPPLGRSDVPPSLEAALQLAMAKDPAKRPPSAAKFGNYLRSLQRELGLPASDLVVPDDLDRLDAPNPTEVEEAAHGKGPPPPPPPRPGPVTHPSESVKAPPPAQRNHPPAVVPDGEISPWAPVEAPGDPESPREPVSSGGPSIGARPPSPTKKRPPRERREPMPVPSLPGEAAHRPTRNRTVAAVAGVLVLAAALVVGVVVLGPDGDDGKVDTAGTTPTVAVSPSTERTPTDVAVRLLSDGVVRVTWKQPADRSGLTGYIVFHRPNGSDADPQQVVLNNAAAAEAVVDVPTPGSRCFVVAAVYGARSGALGSDRACT